MQRSISLDLLKVILCIVIIAGHLYPLFEKDSILGWYIINGYARIVVPIFLLINGYFVANKIENNDAIKQYIKHLLIVYAIWSAFYSQYYITWESSTNIAINLLAGYHHLWYLPALLVGVIMLYTARKMKIKDQYIAIGALLLLGIGYKLGLNQVGVVFYRNGVLFGFTYIVLGYLIKKYSVVNYFKSWQLALLFVAGFITVYLEASIYLGMDIVMDIFLIGMVASPAIFMLCLKHPLLVSRSIFTDYLGYIPTGVYYVHLFYVYNFYSVDFNIYNLPIVFVVSALTIIPLMLINKRVKYIL